MWVTHKELRHPLWVVQRTTKHVRSEESQAVPKRGQYLMCLSFIHPLLHCEAHGPSGLRLATSMLPWPAMACHHFTWHPSHAMSAALLRSASERNARYPVVPTNPRSAVHNASALMALSVQCLIRPLQRPAPHTALPPLPHSPPAFRDPAGPKHWALHPCRPPLQHQHWHQHQQPYWAYWAPPLPPCPALPPPRP